MRKAVILICADAEWLAVKRKFPDQHLQQSPFGEYFNNQIGNWHCIFVQTGWGKIAAASGTQFVIDEFHPDLLVNFGTCGGFGELSECGQIVLADRTVVYDIQEQMGDADAHIAHYSTNIDTSWLKEPLPLQVRRGAIVSADRDLIAEEIPKLIETYHAFAGDWESGAVAWVAQNNRIRLLILRGITDLVSEIGSPAYGDLGYFQDAAAKIMDELVRSLPGWLKSVSKD